MTDEGHNDGNVYVEAYRRNNENLNAIKERLDTKNILIMGEIFGKGVQDLQYDRDTIEFKVFDVYVGDKEQGAFLDYDQLLEATGGIFDTVPELYRGPFSHRTMLEYTQGRSTLANHGREGIVIRPQNERGHPTLDRTIAKSLSEKHLLRKGGTEYN